MNNDDSKPFSIIIPAFNEAESIGATLSGLLLYLKEKKWETEVIVVDDGSIDRTLERLASFNGQIRVVSHPYNKGYGAAVVSGARQASHGWLLMFDADGQHRPESLADLVALQNKFDLVVGSRETGYRGPRARQPGKKILHLVAEYLVQHDIPDLNSGLRLVNKELFLRFVHLYPHGFSLSTTSTLAFLKDGLSVSFVPIQLNPRQGGSSAVSVHDGFKTLMFIIRIIMIFSPLRIFFPACVFIFMLGLASLVFDIIHTNVGDTTVLLLVAGILIFFFGLLADQIAAIRRQIRDRQA